MGGYMYPLFRSKKAAGPAIIILIILIIIIIVYTVSDRAQRECSKDTECSEDYYCGADFQCHEHKLIEKTEIKNYNLLAPSIVLALGIIAAAIILRSKRLERLLNI